MADILSFVTLAQKLVTNLYEVKKTKEHNTMIAHEIDLFVSSLWQNIEMVKRKLPNKNSSSALESMEAEMGKASAYLEDCLNKGYFRAIWDAKKIKEELETLRQNLINNFQLTLFITTFEVVVDADVKVDNFLSKMLQLSALSASRSDAAIHEIRELVQPLVVGMRKQPATYQRIRTFVSTVRENEDEVETSSKAQKFCADVLANLQLGDVTEDTNRPQPEDDRDLYCDPFTFELMCDPIKCSNGRTYDRFSIIEYNMRLTNPMNIVCDDVDVRGRLFEKFQNEGVQSKYHSMRNSFREQALLLAKKGHSGEALTMLNYVLQWAPKDSECLQTRQRMEDVIARQNQQENFSTNSNDCKITLQPGDANANNQLPSYPIPPAGERNPLDKALFDIQESWKNFRSKSRLLRRLTPETFLHFQ